MKTLYRRYLTLLEVMVVICIIGIIASVLGVNMKGSMDKGKEFKTKQGTRQVYDALMLSHYEGVALHQIVKDPKKHLEQTGMFRNAKDSLNDGWGEPLEVTVNTLGDDLVISSNLFIKRMEKKGLKPREIAKEYPWMVDASIL